MARGGLTHGLRDISEAVTDPSSNGTDGQATEGVGRMSRRVNGISE